MPLDYLDELLNNSSASIVEFVGASLRDQLVTTCQIEAACRAEVEADLVKDQFYSLSDVSIKLLDSLAKGPDANMCRVVQKILKSTKLASHTFRDSSELEYKDQPLNAGS